MQVSTTAQSMVPTILSLNVDSVVLWLSGSVGEQHIFVSHAIKDRLMVIMFHVRNRKSYLSVDPIPEMQVNVLLRSSILKMERNMP